TWPPDGRHPPGRPSTRTGVPAAASAAAAPATRRGAPARSGTHHGRGRNPQQRAPRTALGAGMNREPLLVPEPKLEARGAVATHVFVQGHDRASSSFSLGIRPPTRPESPPHNGSTRKHSPAARGGQRPAPAAVRHPAHRPATLRNPCTRSTVRVLLGHRL